jgi:hypothetical protein
MPHLPDRPSRQLLTAFLLPVLLGCADGPRTITVSLKNTETYQYPTVGGDEDGARIVTQPQHYTISEIRRNAGTDWVAVYVYQPLAGFVGSDYAVLEVFTGSDGASPPTHIERIAFDFRVAD